MSNCILAFKSLKNSCDSLVCRVWEAEVPEAQLITHCVIEEYFMQLPTFEAGQICTSSLSCIYASEILHMLSKKTLR